MVLTSRCDCAMLPSEFCHLLLFGWLSTMNVSFWQNSVSYVEYVFIFDWSSLAIVFKNSFLICEKSVIVAIPFWQEMLRWIWMINILGEALLAPSKRKKKNILISSNKLGLHIKWPRISPKVSKVKNIQNCLICQFIAYV